MIRTALEPFAVETLILPDLKITLTVEEDGRSTGEKWLEVTPTLSCPVPNEKA